VSTGLRCDIKLRYPIGLIEAHGTLSIYSARELRACVLKVLPDEPVAIVLDLTNLTAVEDLALTIFPVLGRQAAQWPAVPVLLGAADQKIVDGLQRLGLERSVSLHDTVADALSFGARRPAPSRMSRRLSSTVTAPQSARALAREACAAWRLDALTERAVQVASALASNVVRHAGTDFTIVITRRERYLHIAVRDGSRELPRPVGKGQQTNPPAGHGLRLVDGLSTAWGTRETPDGKVVWSTLRIWQ
jgi:anti-anti-sigma regulatory factor